MRERTGDHVAFSNVLDAAKGAAVKGNTTTEADQRQADQRQSEQFAAGIKSDSRARARVHAEEAFTARRVADADFAAQHSLQLREEAREQAQAHADARAESRLESSDRSRATAKSAERESLGGDATPGGKSDSSVGQADERDDQSRAEVHSERASLNPSDSDDSSATTNQPERADAEQASVADAASANVAGAMASAVAASGLSQVLSSGAISNGGGANTVGGAVGTASALGANAAVAAGNLTALASPGGGAWGAMSSAQAASSAEGVDQMARQLSLLRSIQSAGAAADASKIAAQVALAQQQLSTDLDASASAEASAETTTATAAAASVDPTATTAALAAATPTDGSRGGQFNGGAQSASGVTVKATGSTAADGSGRDGVSPSGAGSGSSLAAGLGVSALANAGLISAEFIPGAPSADGDALSVAQSTAVAKGAVGSESDGGSSAGPDVVQGFAQVARAFDQADAIARARIARLAAQNRSLPAANGGTSAAGTSGAAEAARSLNSFGPNASDAISVEQAARSSGGIAAAGLLGGATMSGLAFGAEGQGIGDGLSLAGATDALASGSGINLTAGLGTGGGGGSSSGPGTGPGGRFAASESGPSAQLAGGAVASGQSAVGSTFNSALSSAGVISGLRGAAGSEADSASFGADAASGAGFSTRVGQFAADAALSGLPGSGVSSAVTPQAIGGSLRADSSGPTTVQGPVATDQLPVALDQTAIDLARLRGGMLTLELAPADLGRLSFEMRIDDSGAAFVAIQLADDTVRALVENAAGALRDSLSREGFKLDSFTVSSGFSSPEQRENSQNRAFAETSNRRVESLDSSVVSSNSVQSRASNTQVRPGTSSLSLFA